jgi:hypothetical protein
MAEDLLEAGGRPGVRGYGADGRVRLVSVFSLGIHESSPGESNGTASRAGRLVFRTVKLLAGSDWLVTCWHEDANEAALHEAVATARTRLDAVDQPPSPGDLAINVVYSVICTYPATERRLHAWLLLVCLQLRDSGGDDVGGDPIFKGLNLDPDLAICLGYLLTQAGAQ